MAYNVIISLSDHANAPKVWLDLSESEIRAFFIQPYLRREVISFRNVTVSPESVDRFKITSTALTSTAPLAAIRAQSVDRQHDPRSPELIYALSGIDATAQFLPPLQSRSDSSIVRLPREQTVFVVYGRDQRLRVSLFTFLRAIGLYPLEWTQAIHATRSSSASIMDIVKAGFRDAQAMVVLFTPDDQARLRAELAQKSDPAYETELTGQPRQNVIFEAGMAWAIDSRRTILMQIGRVRPISDLAGIYTLAMNNSSERRHELAEKLRLAGCRVDTSGSDWLTTAAGDFEAIHPVPEP